MKWFLVLALCLLVMASSMTRYNLMPIQDQLISYYDINAIDYNLLQSLYSWPNSITSLFCGVLMDKIGVNRMLCILWMITMIGCGIVVFSATSTSASFTMLCVGRVVTGIGNEPFNVALKVMALATVDKKHYALVLAVLISFYASAATLNSVFVYQIYSFSNSIQFALAIPIIAYHILAIPLFVYYVHCEHVQIFPKEEAVELTHLIVTEESSKDNNNFKISDLNQFPLIFWLLICVSSLYMVSFETFGNVKVSFFHHMYGYSYAVASLLPIFDGVASTLLPPLFGYMTDRFGKKCYLLIVANILICVAHYLFGFVHINIYFTVFTQIVWATSSAMFYSVIWPAFPIVLDTNSDKLIGTAYGIVNSSRFTLVAIGYVVVGVLTEEKDGNEKYKKVQYFEMALPMLAILCLVVLLQLDRRNGAKLYNPTPQQMSVEKMRSSTIVQIPTFTM